ncbi:hypothetical protein D3C84_570260 [compost metagenome]
MDQRQQGDLLAAEALLAAQGQAQRAVAFELTIELDFIGHHIQTKVALVILGQLEVLRGHFRQAIQPGARLLATGDVEGVEQVQAAQVILEQLVRAAVFAGAFGEHLRALIGAEKQRHPAVEGHVLVQQAYKLGPEIGLVQGVDQLPHRAVPGDVVQRECHASTPIVLPRRRNSPPGCLLRILAHRHRPGNLSAARRITRNTHEGRTRPIGRP